ncbi:LytTR family DNA-binding domain-containing protein [Streptococcus cristatus]|uniref:LytTr DNA-binding domain protein n=1 Tax=Streptococcus cristatus TaxID=45634 RepID=A0A428HK26_STRCR|nr:LytTR family transcriptional regulator DNA-binding domain-containing protein [Streptococcus cristatus]RSJ96133.1 LytTr DNA-binding domain protein [Streptococcus cristatus]
MATIIIKDGSTLRKLDLSTIYYIQSHPQKPHIVLIVTGQDNYSLRASLTELAKLYPDALVHCNRQTLVNLGKVQGLDRERKRLFFEQSDLGDIVCSRRHLTSLIKRWSQEGRK